MGDAEKIVEDIESDADCRCWANSVRDAIRQARAEAFLEAAEYLEREAVFPRFPSDDRSDRREFAGVMLRSLATYFRAQTVTAPPFRGTSSPRWARRMPEYSVNE